MRWAYLLGGILVIAFGVGLYIGAGLGPGPRDGLMTGIAAKGFPLWLVRTVLELTALLAGWLLGGDVGIGTVLFAFGIGPLGHFFLLAPAPRGRRRRPRPDRDDRRVAAVGGRSSARGAGHERERGLPADRPLLVGRRLTVERGTGRAAPRTGRAVTGSPRRWPRRGRARRAPTLDRHRLRCSAKPRASSSR